MPRGLSKQRVVTAALDALDEVGIDGLTVRAVATALEVQAPALYWHVKSKQDLLDEMATELWRRILTRIDDGAGLDWADDLRLLATAIREELLRHRDGAKIFAGTFLTDPQLLRQQESGIGHLVEAGFTVEDVIRGYSLLYSFTVGFCIEEQSVRQTEDDRYSLENRAARVDPERNPLVGAAGPLIFADPQSRFDDLVGVIVEAIGRMRH
jgi:TetR/AcrR family tetracycline transcriptional repressor